MTQESLTQFMVLIITRLKQYIKIINRIS